MHGLGLQENMSLRRHNEQLERVTVRQPNTQAEAGTADMIEVTFYPTQHTMGGRGNKIAVLYILTHFLAELSGSKYCPYLIHTLFNCFVNTCSQNLTSNSVDALISYPCITILSGIRVMRLNTQFVFSVCLVIDPSPFQYQRSYSLHPC
jgi:hypothetical protein